MRKLCVTQLSEEMNEDDPEYHLARHDCQTYGGLFHVGAETRYDGVRDVGTVFYKIRPNLTGSWLATPPAWTIVQDGRSVQASWNGGPGTPGCQAPSTEPSSVMTRVTSSWATCQSHKAAFTSRAP